MTRLLLPIAVLLVLLAFWPTTLVAATDDLVHVKAVLVARQSFQASPYGFSMTASASDLAVSPKTVVLGAGGYYDGTRWLADVHLSAAINPERSFPTIVSSIALLPSLFRAPIAASGNIRWLDPFGTPILIGYQQIGYQLFERNLLVGLESENTLSRQVKDLSGGPSLGLMMRNFSLTAAYQFHTARDNMLWLRWRVTLTGSN